MTKKLITDKKNLIFLDVDFEEMSLENLFIKINDLIEEYGNGAYIDKEYYGYDGGYDLYLYYERYETDKEYKKRVAYEEKQKTKKAKQKAEKEERDKKEYERLKKKFGDT